MSARYIVGDTRAVLRSLEDDSVDLFLTSPPFLALRSYLPDDHPEKRFEIGSESTPGAFLDVLLDVVEECRRVLAPHGSLVFELGDTYAGSGGAGGDYTDGGLRAGQPVFDGSGRRQGKFGDRPHNPGTPARKETPADGSGRRGENRPGGRDGMPTIPGASPSTVNRKGDAWPLAKSLVGVPELFMLALAYGRNLLTGRETPPWRIRNFCPWVRTNPPVGALGDKFRPATSYLTVACVSDRRYFDLDAVRDHERTCVADPAGAPPLDWFQISTEPYDGSHYATWPRKLCVPFIKAMTPLKVCRVCGKPSERIVDKQTEYMGGYHPGKDGGSPTGGSGRSSYKAETLGWTDCDCSHCPDCPGDGSKWVDQVPCTTCDEGKSPPGKWRPGLVLDPFAGSGTTLAVATGHGRDAIGIDLDERNADLALERVGPMFLTIETHTQEAA